jgi:hypothetical protein
VRTAIESAIHAMQSMYLFSTISLYLSPLHPTLSHNTRHPTTLRIPQHHAPTPCIPQHHVSHGALQSTKSYVTRISRRILTPHPHTTSLTPHPHTTSLTPHPSQCIPHHIPHSASLTPHPSHTTSLTHRIPHTASLIKLMYIRFLSPIIL